MKKLHLAAILILCFAAVHAKTQQLAAGEPPDIIATVGDQLITYAQLNTRLNSSAVVGVSTPVLGSEERRTVMLALLDKAISADLLYLDAIRLGIDQSEEYRQDLDAFSAAILGDLYHRQHLLGKIEVSQAEVDAYIDRTFSADSERSERLLNSVEATLRKQKFRQREAQIRESLRQGLEVMVIPARLEPADDAERDAATVVAEYGDRRITWGEVRRRLSTLNNSVNNKARVAALQDYIDQQLMAQKGREAGLDQDPGYRKRLAEFSKTRLLNLHRSRLVERFDPDNEALRQFYLDNRDRIAVKERRRVQMLVLPDQAEANAIKGKIESGEISFYEAVLAHSIAPNAKLNLGDFGWVSKGSGFPALDELTFALEPDTLGGPVESPAGWHLVKVIDLREASLMDFKEETTRKATRRLMLKERLSEYVVQLRQQEFPVVVYEDNLNRLFREEAQWIAAKTREMEANPERARIILEEMRALVE